MKRVQTEVRDEVIIVRPRDDLTGGVETDAMAACVRECAERGAPCVILDLTHVQFINSLGLGSIIACHVSLAKRGTCFLLSNLGERNRQLLEVTKLDSVLKHHKTVQLALTHWAASQPVVRTN